MSKQDQLWTQYEDALFAVLMDRVAAQEGQTAMAQNHALQDAPDAEVPAAVTRRCVRRIRSGTARAVLHQTGRVTRKIAAKVLLAAAISALLFVGVLASSETIRVNTLNLLVEVFDKGTTFRFGNTDPHANTPIEAGFTIGWLPNGFVLTYEDITPTNPVVMYEDDSGASIMIQMLAGENGALAVDTEDAEIESVKIQGLDATLIHKNNEYQLVWAITEKGLIIDIFTTNMTAEDTCHIAESLLLDT